MLLDQTCNAAFIVFIHLLAMKNVNVRSSNLCHYSSKREGIIEERNEEEGLLCIESQQQYGGARASAICGSEPTYRCRLIGGFLWGIL